VRVFQGEKRYLSRASIGREFLTCLMNAESVTRVHIGADKDKFTFAFD
jgi:hypothetical protein